MEWINVKDNLPDSYGDYLVCGDKYNETIVATWDGDKSWLASLYAAEDSDVYKVNPTHWMPLPLPPQTEPND
jgi:hypothetical protein